MSSKRPENSDADDLPDSLDESEEDPGFLQELDEDDEEFSLDQLSRAYARVLNPESRPGDLDEGQDDADPSNQDDDTPDESANEESFATADESIDDDAACPISPETIVEAILFVGSPKDVKLTSRKIASVLRDVSPKEVTKIVKKINSQYESENAAYRISNEKGQLKMVLDESLADFQQEFYGRNKQVKLSQAAIDVMAVVAYNQPLTREQVEKIRAKPSGNILEEISDLPQSHEVSDFDELAD